MTATNSYPLAYRPRRLGLEKEALLVAVSLGTLGVTVLERPSRRTASLLGALGDEGYLTKHSKPRLTDAGENAVKAFLLRTTKAGK